MKTFHEYVLLLEQEPPMNEPPGGPPPGGGLPGGPPLGGPPLGGPPLGGPPPGGPPPGGGLPGGPPLGGPPIADPMTGGSPPGTMAGSQPAALTAKPKDVWQALEEILGKNPSSAQTQLKQEKPKLQLNFLKGTPGF